MDVPGPQDASSNSSSHIRNLSAEYAGAASALIRASFERFIAPNWSPQASDAFIKSVDVDSLERALEKRACALGMFYGEMLTGMLLMPRPAFIQMLFVHPDWTRQGIGRRLWLTARPKLEADFPESTTVELNASPFALCFYRSLGFVPLSSEFIKDGARATRMACWLPAATLGAGLADCPSTWSVD